MKSSLFAIAALMTVALPAVAHAAYSRPGTYASAFIGTSIPRDSDATTDDFITGATFNDRVEFDPGVYIGGTAGYDFGMFRLEGEVSYKRSEIRNVTDQADGYQFRSVDGNLGALALMVNGFYDLHNDSPITPYVGGGIGFATLYLSDTFGTDTRSGSAQRVQLYPADNDTVFAYQAGAGLDFAINRYFSLDLGYRYFGTDTARFGSNFDVATSMKFESHNVLLGFRMKY